MSIPAGFGRLGFGLRSFGAGGPLTVVRALAVAGHVVRVVFNVEPMHQSSAGGADALNPSNYIFGVPGGNATAPIAVATDRDLIVGPVYGVASGTERAVDIHVDRQLVAGVLYNIRIQGIQAAVGGTIGSPDNADFGGVTRIEEVKRPARNQDLVDLSTPLALGHYFVDDSGDLAVTTPDESTRQRVDRRIFTRKNAFRFLTDYGARLDHKGVGNTAQLGALRVDMIQQIKREPDVSAATVQLSVQPSGLTFVSARARTRRGVFVDAGGKVSAVGEVQPFQG